LYIVLQSHEIGCAATEMKIKQKIGCNWFFNIQLFQNSTEGDPNPTRNQKPPTKFIHGVINYGAMINQIRSIAEDEQYSTKSLTNKVI
jgi:hypothetical protein